MTTKPDTSEEAPGGDAKIDRRRTNTREKIEEVATSLFYDQGFQTTTIRQIVEKCAITPAAFYNHFPTKDALLYQIIKAAHSDLESDMQEALSALQDKPGAALAELVRRHVIFHTSHRLRALVSNREYNALPETQAQEIRDSRRRVRGMFEQVITQGLADGAFKPVSAMRDVWPRIAAIVIGEMALRTADWYRPGHLREETLADVYAEMALRIVEAT